MSMAAYNEEFTFIKSPDPLITWSCKVMHHIPQLIATKLGKLVTYYKKPELIKSHSRMNT